MTSVTLRNSLVIQSFVTSEVCENGQKYHKTM